MRIKAWISSILGAICVTGIAFAQTQTKTAPAALEELPPLLMVAPSALTFNAMDDVAKLTVTRDGKPVPAAEIGAPQLLADGHNYHYMLLYSKSDAEPGVLTVKPNPELCEVGSYDLRIPVGKTTLSVRVDTPLKSIKSVVEQQAARTGKTVEEIERERGIVSPLGRETISIALAPEYQVGQTLSVDLGSPEDRKYVWTVNGAVVQEGVGASALQYVFTTPGPCELKVEEFKGGARIAETTAKTLVRETTLEWSVTAKTPFVVLGPKGYGQYVWKIDGEAAGDAQDLHHVFDAPGAHVIECVATQPFESRRPSERRLQWKTTVAAE